MHEQTSPADQNTATGGADDAGFTLVEILIAIVLVGVLSAVAVVGVSSLTSRGSESACAASLDAAKAATVVYFASNANTYPKDFKELTSGADPALELPSEAKPISISTLTRTRTLTRTNWKAVSTGTWTLTMTQSSSGAKPSFACS